MIKMHFALQNEFRLTFTMYNTKYYNNVDYIPTVFIKLKYIFKLNNTLNQI